MKKVEFLTTSAGTYGTAMAGDKKELPDALAAELEEKGALKITGSAGKDEDAEPSKKGLRITDETGKANASAGETNPKNVTGPDLPAPKATPLKTAAKKGKR